MVVVVEAGREVVMMMRGCHSGGGSGGGSSGLGGLGSGVLWSEGVGLL